MGAFLDICFPVGGIVITFLRFLQLGIVVHEDGVVFLFNVYCFGTELHLIMEDRNRCLEIENHKRP